MKRNIHLRMIAFLLAAVMLATLGISVSAAAKEADTCEPEDSEIEPSSSEDSLDGLLAADDPDAIEDDESEEEQLDEEADTEEYIGSAELSTAYADEQEEGDDWNFDEDWDGPRSNDGEPLTREEYGTTADVEAAMVGATEEETDIPMTVALFSASSTVSAAITKTSCVEFPSYTSPYWYCNRYYTDGSHSTGHYFYSGSIAYHKISGKYAYCIEPNTSSLEGTVYTSYTDSTAGSASYWKYELDGTQRSYIEEILAFGYPEVDRGYSMQVQYAATQTLLWEVCAKLRYSSIGSTSDSGLFNNVKTVLGSDYASCYKAILSDIDSGISNGKLPSFAGGSSSDATVITLTHNKTDKTYEATVTDSNNVLSNFTFTADNVTFTRSGKKLTISVPESKIESVSGKTIAAVSSQKLMSTSDPTIWENSTYQTVLTGGGADSPKAYIKLSYEPDVPEPATLKLVKKCSDSSISLKGWKFTIKNKSTGAAITRTTDANGNIEVADLDAGTYLITETAYDGYAAVSAKTVTLEEGETASVTFTNKPLKGNLVISKAANHGTVKGFTFRLHGTSTIGKAVDLTATTDADGTATFSNVYVGTYTLEEVDPGDAYLDPSSQTVTITANSTGTAVTKKVNFNNTWKYWRATVTKVDAETGTTTAQGAASLDGAEYTLYKSGTAVATYTVKNGTFTTGEFPCTKSDSVYTLKETKAPAGYQLSSTVYKLTTGYSNYSNAVNTIKVTVQDSVIKGKIQIEKYAWNHIADTKQPETGASFYVWQKGYASYSKAPDSMRDIIKITSSGKGTSKDLPYGNYYLQQATGWNGYIKDTTKYEVSITENGKTVTKDISGNALSVSNKIWTGKLIIAKQDGDTKEPLANAEFTLVGSDGSERYGKTDGTGQCAFTELVYGVTYTWTEIGAPHGYQLNEKNTGTWSVAMANDEIVITVDDVRRPGSITAQKQDSDGNPLSGCTFLLEYWNGTAWSPVSYRSGSKITSGGCTAKSLKDGCLTTGADGTVTFTGLWADDDLKYRLTEVSAPDGYELLTEPVYEGVLPAAYAASKVSQDPDETVNDTAYFYEMTFTVRDDHVYTLPMTGGHSLQRILAALGLLIFGGMLCARAVELQRYVGMKRKNSSNH